MDKQIYTLDHQQIPIEAIEQLLLENEHIQDVVIIQDPDSNKAFICIKVDKVSEHLYNFVSAKIASLPKYLGEISFELMNNFPRTQSGKIDYLSLQITELEELDVL